jgi:diguanylate cyclase (GGDEF)-like protein
VSKELEQPTRPRILLLGDASARPAGLERALTRAGFQLVEREDSSSEPEADAVLVTPSQIGDEPLASLLQGPQGSDPASPPRIVILSTADRDGPAAALVQGAADALASPVHLPELCARLHARIRERQAVHLASAGGETAARSHGREQGNGGADLPGSGGTDALDRRLQEEFERARRYSLSFSLILLGVDELGGLSEQHGQEAAERRRSEVGGVLRRELRVPDFVVPYGADEFAIVLPETDQIGARQSVVRIRQRLAAVPFEGEPRAERPRFSAGIVTYPHPAALQTDDLFALVEAALMRGRAQAGERIGVAM